MGQYVKWRAPGKASVLVGGQFGSEGKGAAAAWLALHSAPFNMATTNAGAQAGHTTQFKDGRKFVCYHLPTTAVIHECPAYINGGSIIDIEALKKEVADVNFRGALYIHPHAAIISGEDLATERADGSSVSKVASTQKGVGAAITRKIMRTAMVAKDYAELLPWVRRQPLSLNTMLGSGDSIAVEVPQGTGLSLNQGRFYPYCTLRDCWVGSGLSDAGIHPSFLGPVCMVMRTFPIRVGNIYTEQGELVGQSGPFYFDSSVLDWEKNFPDIEPERTTVTKRVRRIASWSTAQYIDGLTLNRPTIVWLGFCDYLKSEAEFLDHMRNMSRTEERLGIVPQHIWSFGPNIEDATIELDRAVGWYKNRSF